MPAGAPLGNKNASKNKVWIAALNRAVSQDDGVRLRAAAEKLIDLAVAGDVQALKELGDRLDGKVAQAVIHASPAEGDEDLRELSITLKKPKDGGA